MFTVILEYQGTTLATQLKASGPDEVLREWVKGLANQEAYGLSEEQRAKLLGAFNVHQSAVPIRGLVNVWCKTILEEDELALMHLVWTVDE